MIFVAPQYAKNQVNKAGRILASPNEYSYQEIYRANEILTNWRTSHAYPINTFQATLRERINVIDPNALVAQRLKRAPSIISKLTRLEKMELARMQDIGGLRAVVATVGQVRKLEETYKIGRLKHKLVRRDDYVESPKEDGYRSIHLVFRYRNDKVPKYNGLHVELQLRTSLQHSWATAVETMGTFLGKSLKSGAGEDKWKEFFLATSAGFAVKEGLPLPVEYQNTSRPELYEIISGMESELNILKTLSSFTIATDHITENRGHGVYHLVVLDSVSREVSVTPYSARMLDLAAKDYAEVEERSKDGGGIEAVLVSAGSISALKRAYPNYFLDTHMFIREVKRMIKESSSSSKATKDEHRTYKRRKDTVDVDKYSLSWITSRDIPQADDIDSVRNILDVIREGTVRADQIAAKTGISLRHVHYKLLAAEILGCLRGGIDKSLTATGESWLRRDSGSEEEARFLRDLIEGTLFYQIVVPDLFDLTPPGKQAIANRIISLCKLSETTALRRASSLLAWSSRLRQCALPMGSN